MSLRERSRTGSMVLKVLVTVTLVFNAASCSQGGETAAENTKYVLSEQSLATADYALEQYRNDIIETLADLVSFKTVAVDGIANADNPEFKKMSEYLKNKAAELGLDFEDHGAVVVIGLGDSEDRFGMATHGDVQPADPEKWAFGPFTLDSKSEPDKLIGRGAEDDKGPIAIALYAMKALKDKEIPLGRRLELIISYTEESDWEPFMQFLEENQPPQLNVALDSLYPAGTAEKGWCGINIAFSKTSPESGEAGPRLLSLTGGAFLSQVPEDAAAVIANANMSVEQILRSAAEADSEVEYDFETGRGRLTITALGKSAHSSEPEEGVNAITHLAAVLGNVKWARNSTSLIVDFINDLVGTGFYGGKFGDIAYSHDFMGPLTLSLGTLEERDDQQIVGINLRRPVGKERSQLEQEIRKAISDWQQENGVDDIQLNIYIGDPHLITDAPHIPVLLSIFSHFTGTEDPQPKSSGGGTHARLLPNGVSFGPHMPGRAYTGHSEYEYLSLQELDQDINMYTAMMVEMATKGDER